MAVVFTKGRDGALQELGRTEVVLNSLNPKWIKRHTVTYHFEVVQTLVYVSDSIFAFYQINTYLPSFTYFEIPSVTGFVCMMSTLSFTIMM